MSSSSTSGGGRGALRLKEAAQLGKKDVDLLFALDMNGLEIVTSLVLAFLDNQSSSEFQESLGSFATSNQIPSSSLKVIVKALIIICRGAITNGLTSTQLQEDLLKIGTDPQRASIIAEAWQSKRNGLTRALLHNMATANQLVDMEWSFGVSAATNEVRQVGSAYLQVKLVIDKGNQQRQDVFMELSLSQFYQFLANMETAKSYVDYLSAS